MSIMQSVGALGHYGIRPSIYKARLEPQRDPDYFLNLFREVNARPKKAEASASKP